MQARDGLEGLFLEKQGTFAFASVLFTLGKIHNDLRSYVILPKKAWFYVGKVRF